MVPSAQLGHRHAISARGVVQGGGTDKLCGKKCFSNHCKKDDFDSLARLDDKKRSHMVEPGYRSDKNKKHSDVHANALVQHGHAHSDAQTN